VNSFLQAKKEETETKEKENVVNDTVVESEAKAQDKPKAEAKEVKADDDGLMDTDDEDTKPAAKKSTDTDSRATKSMKRVIEDSDSEEEDEPIQSLKKSDGETMKVDKDGDYSDDGTVSIDNEEDELSGEEEEEEEDAPKKSKSAPQKKQKTLMGKNAVTEKKLNVGTKSASTAAGMKSNDQLLHILTEQMKRDEAWKEGKPLPYSALCDTFSSIESISSRLEIQEKLTELFRLVLLRDGGGGDEAKSRDETKTDGKKKADPKSDLYSLIYLASNTVAPSYECVELGVGDSILIKAIGEASGTAPNIIKKKYEAEGDLGTVAQTSKGKQKTLVGFGRMVGPKRLEAKEVLKVFREIATTSGSQSQKWKVDKIKGLLVRAKESEPKYIIRGLQGKLRIGLAQSTVLVALAHAVMLTRPKEVVPLTDVRLKEIREMDDGDEGMFILWRLCNLVLSNCVSSYLFPLDCFNSSGAYPDFARKLCGKNLARDVKLETAVQIIKKAYSEVPSYDILLDALLTSPLQELHNSCKLTPGVPVVPMLAKPTKSVAEVLKRLDGLRFTCEYKYDGERAQVHQTPDGTTKVFSRNLLNTSEKFPEVPLYVKEACKDESVTSFVLDTEVVGECFCYLITLAE
jgi:DNA ligase-1